MKSDHSATQAVSRRVSSAFASKVQRTKPTLISFSALALSVVRFTQIAGARGTTARRHANGICGSSFTSRGAPNAGTNLLQRTSNNNTGNRGTPPGTSSVSVSASAAGSCGANHVATLTITVTQ